jgi:SNF2 family DNA or RNA helicase
VEEKILTMQQKKQALLEDLFLEQDNSKTTLSLDDLNVLFEFEFASASEK